MLTIVEVKLDRCWIGRGRVGGGGGVGVGGKSNASQPTFYNISPVPKSEIFPRFLMRDALVFFETLLDMSLLAPGLRFIESAGTFPRSVQRVFKRIVFLGKVSSLKFY